MPKILIDYMLFIIERDYLRYFIDGLYPYNLIYKSYLIFNYIL